MAVATHWRKNLSNLAIEDEGVQSNTVSEQSRVEHDVMKIFKNYRDNKLFANRMQLITKNHETYLLKGLRTLPGHFECLDASRPWLCYWILHSLELLKRPIGPSLASEVVDFLSRCQHPDGGFGGGPGQLPHLAPTYAAVLALCTIGTESAYNIIDRPKLQLFLTRMHQPDGSFIMHDDGEVDVRGAYCAVVAATLANVLSEEMVENTPTWIASCQTYEGGFSAVPGTEAHGGYTFCAFACLMILKRLEDCNVNSVLKWATRRQMKLEGGFQGRTNKLVDGCYSFWVGGLFPLIHLALKQIEGEDTCVDHQNWQFDQEALQEYVMFCCQSINGGLIDKPGKHSDYYHTCYCLSGLSVSQHGASRTVDISDTPSRLLAPIHPTFNISLTKAAQAMEHFSKLPTISIVPLTT